MTDDRRGSQRHPAHLAGELETSEGVSSIAVTQDVGAGGLLVYTRDRGCTGTVTLTVLSNNEHLVLSGTVVRQEPINSPQWRTKVAIAVDQKDPVLAKLLAAIRAQGE